MSDMQWAQDAMFREYRMDYSTAVDPGNGSNGIRCTDCGIWVLFSELEDHTCGAGAPVRGGPYTPTQMSRYGSTDRSTSEGLTPNSANTTSSSSIVTPSSMWAMPESPYSYRLKPGQGRLNDSYGETSVRGSSKALDQASLTAQQPLPLPQALVPGAVSPNVHHDAARQRHFLPGTTPQKAYNGENFSSGYPLRQDSLPARGASKENTDTSYYARTQQYPRLRAPFQAQRMQPPEMRAGPLRSQAFQSHNVQPEAVQGQAAQPSMKQTPYPIVTRPPLQQPYGGNTLQASQGNTELQSPYEELKSQLPYRMETPEPPQGAFAETNKPTFDSPASFKSLAELDRENNELKLLRKASDRTPKWVANLRREMDATSQGPASAERPTRQLVVTNHTETSPGRIVFGEGSIPTQDLPPRGASNTKADRSPESKQMEPVYSGAPITSRNLQRHLMQHSAERHMHAGAVPSTGYHSRRSSYEGYAAQPIESTKSQKLPTCRRCKEPIRSRALYDKEGKLSGKFHAHCFKCFDCGCSFDDGEFYIWNDTPLCAQHYHFVNESICANHTCRRPIEGPCIVFGQSPKMRYHAECFVCSVPRCSRVLSEYHYVVKGEPCCEEHFLHSHPSQSDASSSKRRTLLM